MSSRRGPCRGERGQEGGRGTEMSSLLIPHWTLYWRGRSSPAEREEREREEGGRERQRRGREREVGELMRGRVTRVSPDTEREERGERRWSQGGTCK